MADNVTEETDTCVMVILAKTFGVKGLTSDYECCYDFSESKLTELKNFLKITSRLKGLTNSKKEKLLETVKIT